MYKLNILQNFANKFKLIIKTYFTTLPSIYSAVYLFLIIFFMKIVTLKVL